MPDNQPHQLPKLLLGQRRKSIVAAYANGGLWGFGDGLAGTTLVFYLARQHGATGVALSWLLAAPKLLGVLRLFTPLWIQRVGSRKYFCLTMFAASAIALLGLPLLSAPKVLPATTQSIIALLMCWASYHLLMYFGLVALWAWFNDFVPQAIRGRFIGRRAAWMNVGKIAGIVLSATANFYWQQHCANINRQELHWLGFAALAAVGAFVMLLSVYPLVYMRDITATNLKGTTSLLDRLRQVWQPFQDPDFQRMLCYGAWFSFANGITTTAIRIYQISVLQISYSEKRILDSSSRGIQATIMPVVGKLADQRGNVPVLVVSQGLVAAALLFLLPATSATKWWIIGTYFLWTAYAGTNVAMPNLMLKFSQHQNAAAYSAVWFALLDLVYAISTLLGGVLFDWASQHWASISFGEWQLNHFTALIFLGFLLRSFGMLLAARIREPIH